MLMGIQGNLSASAIYFSNDRPYNSYKCLKNLQGSNFSCNRTGYAVSCRQHVAVVDQHPSALVGYSSSSYEK